MPATVTLLVPISISPWEAGVGASLVLLALGGVAALLIRHRDRVMRHPHGPLQ